MAEDELEEKLRPARNAELRNIIGAVVGVQPFGGSGLSGTGPKAGGPLYLGRLLGIPPQTALEGLEAAPAVPSPLRIYADWLRAIGFGPEAERVVGYLGRSALGARVELPGPVGERNVYFLRPRGRVAVLAEDTEGLLLQVGAVLATGNVAVVQKDHRANEALQNLPKSLWSSIEPVEDWREAPQLRAVLFEGEPEGLLALNRTVAALRGPILPIQATSMHARRQGADYDLNLLLEECSISTNTAAAGGNASLMSIG